MGKATKTNFKDGQVRELLDSTIFSFINYYVDPVNGNDNNNGITKDTAFKTINKINTLISRKNAPFFGNISVYLLNGVHEGTIVVERSKGHGVTIIGESASTIIRSSSRVIKANYCAYVRLENLTVEFSGDTGEAFELIAIDYFATMDNVLFKYVGSSPQNTHLLIADQFCGITLLGNVYENFQNIGNIHGGTSLIVAPPIPMIKQSFKPRVNVFSGSTFAGSHFYDNSFTVAHTFGSGGGSENIIIETGTNENGSYMKYADGTLICHNVFNYSKVNIDTPMDTRFTSPSRIWNFPHNFTGDISPKVFFEVSYCIDKFLTSGIGNKAVDKVSASVRLVYTSATVVEQAGVSLMAIGRWK